MSENDENLMLFEADLAKFAEILDVNVGLVMKRVALDAHTRFSKRTPVDTGRARASWDVKIGSPSEFVPPVSKKKVAGKGNTRLGKGIAGNALGKGAKSGGRAKDVSGAISAIDGTQIVFITTNLDYMEYLEKGSSTQAPVGMVQISLAEMEVEIETIIELNS